MNVKTAVGRKPQMQLQRWGDSSTTSTQPTALTQPASTSEQSSLGIVAGEATGARDSIDPNKGLVAEQPKVDTAAAYDTGRSMSKAAYTPEQQSESVTLADNLARQAATSYANAATKKVADPYYATNQAWQDKYGNLNKKDYDSTLALSRLTDQFNNQLHFAPGGTIGMNSELGTTAMQNPGFTKYNTETQEARQMRSNEQAADLARQESIRLQSDAQRMSYDAMKRAMNSTADVAALIGTSGVEVERAWQNAIMQNEYNAASTTYWTQVTRAYMEQLTVHMAAKKTEIVSILEKYTPALAAIIQPMFGSGIVDLDAWTEFAFKQQFKNELLKDPTFKSLPEGEKAALIAGFSSAWDLGTYQAEMEKYKAMFTNTFTNKGTRIGN